MKKTIQTLIITMLGTIAVVGASSAQDPEAGKKLYQEVKSRIKTISTDELKTMIDTKQDFILLDVRNRSDIESMGKIDAPQQVEIERAWLESRVPDLVEMTKNDPDKPIVTYCGVGQLSAYSADTLQKLGFKNVYSYDSGFLGWESKGYPVKYKETK